MLGRGQLVQPPLVTLGGYEEMAVVVGITVEDDDRFRSTGDDQILAVGGIGHVATDETILIRPRQRQRRLWPSRLLVSGDIGQTPRCPKLLVRHWMSQSL